MFQLKDKLVQYNQYIAIWKDSGLRIFWQKYFSHRIISGLKEEWFKVYFDEWDFLKR
jgi:hypothetical protein